MEKNLTKQVKFLQIYAGILTVVCILFFLVAFKEINSNPHFKEIDVERINIVEKSGKVKMVISNQERQSPGIEDGKVLPARNRPPGIIFFNSDGNECGGLIYDGDKKHAGLFFSVDQYQQDQIMQLQYSQEKNDRHYGLQLYDRPDNISVGGLMKRVDSLKSMNNDSAYKAGIANLRKKNLIGNERMFVGKNASGEVGLFIKDSNGVPRVRLYVDKNGKGKIEFMNEDGK